jgi:hypothetical protein
MSEVTRDGDANRAITETASISPLRLRRPEVRLSVGLWTGLVAGPLLGFVMVFLPGDFFLGPYPTPAPQYPKKMADSMAVQGFCFGLPTGLAIALHVLLLQRWWRGERGVVASPGPHWPETLSKTNSSAPNETGIRTSSDRTGIQGEDDR